MDRRLTISLHDHPRPHLDVFLERRGDPPADEELLTFRAEGGSLDALLWPGVHERQPHHRARYLDYEGEVGGGRGTVTVLGRGRFRERIWLGRDDEPELLVGDVDLSGAAPGRLRLQRGEHGWRSDWVQESGLFVAFEGIDGSGKSSCMQRLAQRLEGAWVTREPTTSGFGAVIRERLIGAAPQVPEAMALAFAADRAEHLYTRDGILHRRSRGEVVLCDRYKLSSLTYQTEAGAGASLVERVNRAFPEPDLTLVFDLDPEIALARLESAAGRGGDLYERAELLTGVRRRTLEWVNAHAAGPLAEIMPVRVIDASADPDEVAAAAEAAIRDAIATRARSWIASARPG